ncbi:MAG: UDP-N-acetyl-D-glucosaminuronic acid 3-dehydrogenase [Candidatus Fermentimicrarchaeum limneticum]|uniref:UDP-N-acetyl-D-glucosaminuronic acid 3-dehydrogenase n=1 Tax=Fermentimicrarchaeum limneticum TaxID=2795018 RepID=A0A7D6BEQ4_FERL1|nr:MAG: UDP-N-acetyl-D-glucosaminuronic acid 3-dehydrogenase [Candidatus Fermentimicrarchaeum limneticum]
MIKVGVIGTGSMGRNHARVYSQLPDVSLVGVADVNRNLVQSVAKEYNTAAFTEYPELLKQGLDAVSIAVPTSLHKKVAIDAAENGVDILLEKPISDTISNARKIIEACEKNKVKLMVGHIERFNPIVDVIKSRIDENTISINIRRLGPLPPRVADVGVVVDLAIHDIDIIRYITNSEFKKVYGLTSTNLSNHEDTAILSFEMENGILANINANWLTPFKVREIDIAGKRNFIRGYFIEQKVIEYAKHEDNSYTTQEIPVKYAEPLKIELEKFVECVRQGKEPPISGHEALKALEIAVRCLRSR